MVLKTFSLEKNFFPIDISLKLGLGLFASLGCWVGPFKHGPYCGIIYGCGSLYVLTPVLRFFGPTLLTWAPKDLGLLPI